jgi:hypothetical protein
MFDVDAIEHEQLSAKVKKLESDLERLRAIMTAFTESTVGIVSVLRDTGVSEFGDSEFERMADSSAQLFMWTEDPDPSS